VGGTEPWWITALLVDGKIFLEGDKTLLALNSNYSFMWSYGGTEFQTCIADSRNIYRCNNENADPGTSNHVIADKISPDGKLVWSYDIGDSADPPMFDSAENVYIGPSDVSVWPVQYSLKSNGKLNWSYTIDNVCNWPNAIDSKDVCYLSTNWPLGQQMAFNSNGSLKWSYHYHDDGQHVLVDKNDNLFSGKWRNK